MDNIIKFFDNNNINIDFENDNISVFNNIIHNNDKSYHNNDLYNEKLLNSLNYYPETNLNKNIKINDLDINNTLISIYQIVENNNNPFLLFYLINNNDKLEWPTIYNFNDITHFNNFNSIDEVLNKLYYFFDRDICTILFTGIHYDNINKKNILWFKYKNNFENNFINKHLWISLYEILNTNKFLNININISITNYFLYNKELIYLTYYDYLKNKEINLDIPIIAFYGNSKSYNNFILKYDIIKEPNKSRFGSYYYFCNFNLLKKYIQFNKSNTYSYIRYAIFIKKYKYLNNHEIFNMNLWNNNDSIIYNLNNNNIKYILKNKNNIVPLSLH